MQNNKNNFDSNSSTVVTNIRLTNNDSILHGPGTVINNDASDPEFPKDPDYIREYENEDGSYSIRLVSQAKLPSRYGMFTIYGFLDERENKEHTAIVSGSVAGAGNLPVRVHSECHTGDVLGSLRCDCRDQLEAALKYISENSPGMVIYLKQEGRGIGLLNKIQAYNLQDHGFDTVDANTHLGLPAEARDYTAAHAVLEILKVKSVQLLTNNPAKVTGLTDLGINVTKRLPLVIEANNHSRNYLATKKARMGHLY
jgi:GTP cyclohydrolase II